MPKVKVSGGELHYRIAGDAGPWLVFVTGLNGLGSFWDGQLEHYSKRYRVLAHDHLGYGESRADVQSTEIEALTDDVVAMLDHAGAESINLVGHSMGGMISQTLVLRQPERVASLVLSGTGPGMDDLGRMGGEFRLDVLKQMGLDAFVRLQTIVNAGSRAATLSSADILDQEARSRESLPSPELLWSRLRAATYFDRRADLHAIKVPTLVIAADDDDQMPLRHSKRLAAAIPGATLRKLPVGGHFFPRTQCREYCALLDEFLARVLASDVS